jgi:hypothetical protein
MLFRESATYKLLGPTMAAGATRRHIAVAILAGTVVAIEVAIIATLVAAIITGDIGNVARTSQDELLNSKCEPV